MAKRFEFRLETVRRLRKQAQDECRRAVAGRLRQISEARGRIARLSEQLGGQQVAARDLVLAGAGEPDARLDVRAVRQHRVYMNHLHQSIVETRQELARLGDLLAEDQAALDGATKQLRVIDKLEEKQRKRHELAVQRLETAESDEIATQHARRQGAPGGGAAFVDG